MTGPEHYAEAERLLQGWDETMNEQHDEVEVLTAAPVSLTVIAAAQAHATLALAAATALPAGAFDEWSEALKS
jgi:hypothetical protein